MEPIKNENHFEGKFPIVVTCSENVRIKSEENEENIKMIIDKHYLSEITLWVFLEISSNHLVLQIGDPNIYKFHCDMESNDKLNLNNTENNLDRYCSTLYGNYPYSDWVLLIEYIDQARFENI